MNSKQIAVYLESLIGTPCEKKYCKELCKIYLSKPMKKQFKQGNLF